MKEDRTVIYLRIEREKERERRKREKEGERKEKERETEKKRENFFSPKQQHLWISQTNFSFRRILLHIPTPTKVPPVPIAHEKVSNFFFFEFDSKFQALSLSHVRFYWLSCPIDLRRTRSDPTLYFLNLKFPARAVRQRT